MPMTDISDIARTVRQAVEEMDVERLKHAGQMVEARIEHVMAQRVTDWDAVKGLKRLQGDVNGALRDLEKTSS